MSEQKNELRQIITDALVSMVSGVTGLVPPSGPGQIPDFIQAPIDRAVERISASQPVGVPDDWRRAVYQAEECLTGCLASPDIARNLDADTVRKIVANLQAARFAMLAAPTVKAEQPDCVYCQGHGDVTRISGQTAESYSEHNEECPECKGTGLAPYLPAAGLAVEEVEVVGYRFFHVDHGYIFRRTHIYEGNPSLEAHSLMTVAQHQRIVAALSAQQSARQPELTVWEGQMPESNGKSNFTAVLMRKGADLFDGIAGGMTIARSEYPDRVRYEADCVRWLIGELDERPCIIDYDADKHSGYVAQQSAPERVRAPRDLLERVLSVMDNYVTHETREEDELRALLSRNGNGGGV